jgi:hypothetical protein
MAVHLAAKDADVDEALALWASQPRDWSILYKVFEVIEHRGGARAGGVMSRNQATRFTRTANHQEAAGHGARHARSSADPPPEPMSILEAEQLLGRLLTAWIADLEAGSAPSTDDPGA